MLPEIEKFFAEYNNTDPFTPEEIKERMDSAYATLAEEAKQGSDNYAAFRKFESVATGLFHSNTRFSRQAAAWADLAKSDDKMIKYLAAKVQPDYESYVLELLPNLPLTLPELDAFAQKNDWCSDYDSLVSRAQRAGVLPDDTGSDLSEARKNLHTWFSVNWSERRTSLRTLFEHIDKIVAEAVNDEKEQEDSTKADEMTS